MLKHLFPFIVVVVLITSCEYIAPEPPAPIDPYTFTDPTDTTPKPPDTTPQSIISLSGYIQPVIFTKKCLPCHKAGNVLPVLENGKAYASLWSMGGMLDTASPSNSVLYKKMNTGGSMNQYCKKRDADSVLKWIDQGAKDN